jgi:hypothetical protein
VNLTERREKPTRYSFSRPLTLELTTIDKQAGQHQEPAVLQTFLNLNWAGDKLPKTLIVLSQAEKFQNGLRAAGMDSLHFRLHTHALMRLEPNLAGRSFNGGARGAKCLGLNAGALLFFEVQCSGMNSRGVQNQLSSEKSNHLQGRKHRPEVGRRSKCRKCRVWSAQNKQTHKSVYKQSGKVTQHKLIFVG